MKNQSWFLYRSNKSNYLAATKAVVGIILAIELGQRLFGHNLVAILWMVGPLMFASFSVTGETKRKQLFASIEHLGYTLVVINVAVFALLYSHNLTSLSIGIIIFLCMVLPWLRVGTSSFRVFLAAYVLFVLMLHNMKMFAPENYLHYMYLQSISCLIGTIITIIVMLCFPLDKLEDIDSRRDNYILVQALRAAIAIIIVIAITQIFHLYNVAWICFAVLAVCKGSLSDSFTQAMQRLMGTIFGVIVGVLFAHYIAHMIEVFNFSALVFVYLGLYMIRRHYAVGLFFFTLLLAALFYVTKLSHVNIDQYLMVRLIDTFIGLIIGVACEILILPRSHLEKLRMNICLVYRDFWFLMMLLKQPHQKKDVKELLGDIKQRVITAENYMQGVRNEPLVLLNRRYKYFKSLPKYLNDMFSTIEHTALKEMSPETLGFAQEFFGTMRKIYIKSESVNKKLLRQQQKQLDLLLLKANKNGEQLLQKIKLVLELYQQMYAVKKWRLSWH